MFIALRNSSSTASGQELEYAGGMNSRESAPLIHAPGCPLARPTLWFGSEAFKLPYDFVYCYIAVAKVSLAQRRIFFFEKKKNMDTYLDIIAFIPLLEYDIELSVFLAEKFINLQKIKNKVPHTPLHLL